MSTRSGITAQAPTAAERIGAAVLQRGRYTPDFTAPFTLDDDTRAVLTMRGLDAGEQERAGAIWSSAREAVANGQGRAFLKTLDAGSLAVLQEAAGLADRVAVSTLSEEGAENLLIKPTEAIDRNHDGLLEVGVGKLIVFPPPDASPALRSAWASTVDGLESGDVAMLALQLAAPAIPVDGGDPKIADVSSPDFDWKGRMEALFEGAAVSAPWNDAETNRRTIARLTRFREALKDNGLA